MNRNKKLFTMGGGLLVGVINGLLGAGGGMLAVPLLRLQGKNQCEAHANSVALIFVLSLVSAAAYLMGGHVKISDVVPLLPFGIAGAVIGALVLKKIPDKLLRKIFAVFMVWAGVRLLMR